jgi:rare lipoprotein A
MGKQRKWWIIGIVFTLAITGVLHTSAQTTTPAKPKTVRKILYGTASFYANSFNGRKTANGEIFNQAKLTCACNVVPIGTMLKVTNLRNGKSVIVKVNDRLHPRMKRLVDLTRSAAKQLGFIASGLTRVKAEVIGRK